MVLDMGGTGMHQLFDHSRRYNEGLGTDGTRVGADENTPIGAIIAWHKTFGLVDSGTTDGTTANRLIDSSQNFLTTIVVGDTVFNSTDDTYATVTAVNSDTMLSLNANIMVSGEAYKIYKTPLLPSGWLECNGQLIDDGDSVYHNLTMPNLNGGNRFLMGSENSGGTGGSVDHYHTTGSGHSIQSGTGDTIPNSFIFSTESNFPPYFNVVWIMRIR